MGSTGNGQEYFVFPEARLKVPLYSSEGTRLSIGLVEVGCSADGKRSQLRDKKSLLAEVWWSTGLNETGWKPRIYRSLAHYSPQNVGLRESNAGVDLILQYTEIPPSFLVSLTERDKETILRDIASTGKRTKLSILEQILGSNDVERLNHLIFNERSSRSFAALRGKMAELVAQGDIYAALPEGMILFCNSQINYVTHQYKNGTEIDGILVFYGEQPYLELVENLHHLPHVEVNDRWHQPEGSSILQLEEPGIALPA